jgi:AcrR family transcriptional regulator
MRFGAEILSPSERERILQAVAELGVEQGFQATTVEQIVERAGISRKAFASQFADVEECMAAAVSAMTAEILAVVSGAYSADLAEWQSMMRGAKGILDLMAAHPTIAFNGFVAARQMTPPKVREVYGFALQMLVMMVNRLWDYSSVEAQPSMTALAALGGGEAVVRREVMAGRADQLPAKLPDFVYATIVPFLGQGEALRMAGQAREMLAGTEWA